VSWNGTLCWLLPSADRLPFAPSYKKSRCASTRGSRFDEETQSRSARARIKEFFYLPIMETEFQVFNFRRRNPFPSPCSSSRAVPESSISFFFFCPDWMCSNVSLFGLQQSDGRSLVCCEMFFFFFFVWSDFPWGMLSVLKGMTRLSRDPGDEGWREIATIHLGWRAPVGFVMRVGVGNLYEINEFGGYFG